MNNGEAIYGKPRCRNFLRLVLNTRKFLPLPLNNGEAIYRKFLTELLENGNFSPNDGEAIYRNFLPFPLFSRKFLQLVLKDRKFLLLVCIVIV